MPEEKSGIRVPKNIISIVISVLVLVGIFVTWGIKMGSLGTEIEFIERRLTTVEEERTEYTKALHAIELRLESIDTKLEVLEK